MDTSSSSMSTHKEQNTSLYFCHSVGSNECLQQSTVRPGVTQRRNVENSVDNRLQALFVYLKHGPLGARCGEKSRIYSLQTDVIAARNATPMNTGSRRPYYYPPAFLGHFEVASSKLSLRLFFTSCTKIFQNFGVTIYCVRILLN